MGRSQEYYDYVNSDEWKKKSTFIRKFFFNRCILFPWLKSKHTHHLTYANFKDEWIWYDVLPLSESGHSLIHLPFLWKFLPARWVINFYLRMVSIPLFFIFVMFAMGFAVADVFFPPPKKQKKQKKLKKAKG